MRNPYQRKLISDMIMNVLLTVLLVINMFPTNFAARVMADEINNGEGIVENVDEEVNGNEEEGSELGGSSKDIDENGESSNENVDQTPRNNVEEEGIKTPVEGNTADSDEKTDEVVGGEGSIKENPQNAVEEIKQDDVIDTQSVDNNRPSFALGSQQNTTSETPAGTTRIDLVSGALSIPDPDGFTVTWKNGEKVLETDLVAYGEIPSYNGETPEKEKDAQYTYTFSGWDNDITAPITEDTVFNAVYDTELNKYTVTWKNYDETVLETDTEVEYGTLPTYDGEGPEKEKDQDFIYEFNGWDPEVSEVTGDVEYTAVFTQYERKHSVTFDANAEGVTGMPEAKYEYDETEGEWYSVKPETDPQLEGSVFVGWSYGPNKYTPFYNEEGNSDYINGDTTVYAIWEEVDKKEVVQIGENLPSAYYKGRNGSRVRGKLASIEDQGNGTYRATVKGNSTYNITLNTSKEPGTPYGVKIVSGAGTSRNPYVLEILFKYTVTFVDEDGTPVQETLEYPEGARLVASDIPENPQKPADKDYTYTFAGWTPEINYRVNSNATYTATYTAEAIKYNMVFEANGDNVTNMPEYANIYYDQQNDKYYFIQPDLRPEREGYDFVEWSYSATEFDPVFYDYLEGVGWISGPITSKEPVTVYATWFDMSKYIAILRDYQDEEKNSDIEGSIRWDETLTFANYIEEPYDREGYEFLGWFTEPTGGEQVSATTPVPDPSTITEEYEGQKLIRLYAHWGKENITVSFNENNSATAPTVVEKELDTKVESTYESIMYTPEDREGYKFLGWYTEKEEGTKVEATEQLLAKDDHTLYAHWEKLSVKITFNNNDGVRPSTVEEVVDLSTAETYGDVGTFLIEPKRVGYVFVGWFTELSGGEEVDAYDQINPEDHTLYAHWDYVGTIYVTFDRGYGSLTDRYNIVAVTNTDQTYEDILYTPEREGYDFLGWFTESTGGIEVYPDDQVNLENHTLYAQWKIKTFEIVFYNVDAEGGVELLTSVETNYQEVPVYDGETPVRESTQEGYIYRFIGWTNDESDLETPKELEPATRNETYYAVYEEVRQHEVTFMDGDAVIDVQFVDDGDTIILPEKPSKEGYIFDAWVDDKGIQFNPSTPVTEDLTLYARWSELHKVTFLVNGEVYYEEAVRHGEKIKNVPEKPKQEGYVFDGWIISGATGEDKYFDFNTEITSALYVSASWVELFTVKFMDGNRTFDTQTVLKNDTATKPASDPSRRGYEFVGWYLNDEEYDFNTKVTEDLVLDAKYEVEVYHITYDLGEGGELEDAKETYTIEDDTFTLGIPTRPGYRFKGWTGTDIRIIERTVTIRKGSTGNRTYTAVWLANSNTPYTVEHYMQNVDDDDYKLIESETRRGFTDSEVTVSGKREYIRDYMSHVNTELSTLTGSIAGDGSLVLKIYYDKNTYTLRVNTDKGIEKITANGEVISGSKDYKAGVVVNLVATVKPGYVLIGRSQRTVSMVDHREETFNTSAITYKISYDLDGGHLRNPKRYYNVESPDFSLGTPVKDGYTFVGWLQTEPEAETEPKQEVIIPTGSIGDRAYKAVWVANIYYVDFEKGFDPEGEMERQTFNFDEAQKLNKNQFTRWGFEFTGWKDDNGNSYADEEEVINLTNEPEGVVTLYPEWELATYTATFKLGEGETLVGERTNPFTYTIYDYKKNLDPYGIEQETTDIEIIDTAEKEGYTFLGWEIYNAEETVKLSGDEPTSVIDYEWNIAEDIVLVPVYEANTYKLIFHINNEVAEDAHIDLLGYDGTMDVTYDKEIGAMPRPESVRYHFQGWFDAQGNEYNAGTVYKVAGDTDLYAVWYINASALNPTDEGGNKVINNVPDDIPAGLVYNDLGEPVILNCPTGSTVIPAGELGGIVTKDNYRGAVTETHLYTVVPYDLSSVHHIDLIVNMLRDENDKKAMVNAARERGFKNATDTNSILFEGKVLEDGIETQLTGDIIIVLSLTPFMCKVPDAVNREFKVFHRLNNGTIKEEPIVGLDLSKQVIKIRVSEFSPFIIVYNDTLKPDRGGRIYRLPLTGVTVDEGSHTIRLMTMVAAVALGTTMRAKNRLGRKYWDDLK